VDQYVWSVTYIDAPVGRWHDANNDGDCEDTNDNIRYFTHDGNQNVTAAVEGTFDSGSQQWQWQLAERYVYTPYGKATGYDADWSAGSAQAPAADGPLYCGYFFDAETSVYHVRHRQYHPTLSTWLTRDPLLYSAGDRNLYRYVGNRPITAVDADGLFVEGIPGNYVVYRSTFYSRYYEWLGTVTFDEQGSKAHKAAAKLLAKRYEQEGRRFGQVFVPTDATTMNIGEALGVAVIRRILSGKEGANAVYGLPPLQATVAARGQSVSSVSTVLYARITRPWGVAAFDATASAMFGIGTAPPLPNAGQPSPAPTQPRLPANDKKFYRNSLRSNKATVLPRSQYEADKMENRGAAAAATAKALAQGIHEFLNGVNSVMVRLDCYKGQGYLTVQTEDGRVFPYDDPLYYTDARMILERWVGYSKEYRVLAGFKTWADIVNRRY